MNAESDAQMRGSRADGSFKTYVGEHVIYNEEQRVSSFIQAMELCKPRRLFVDFGSWGFVTEGGEAHVLVEKQIFGDQVDHINQQITDASQLLNLLVVDGFIRTHDHTGQIYQIFSLPPEYQSRFPSKEQAEASLQIAYKNWSDAAKEVLAQNPDSFIQYYDRNSYLNRVSQTVDLTSGNQHYVTTLQPVWNGKTLRDVRSDFPGVRMQDNTSIYDWGRVLFQGERA